MTTATSNSIQVSLFSVGDRLSPASAEIKIPDSLQVVEDVKGLPKTHGVFKIMTPEDGDKRVVWDTLSMQEINDAQSMFNDLIGSGLRAYKVNPNGTPGGQIDEFDATAGEILFLPVKAARGG